MPQKYITSCAVNLFANQSNFISKLNNKISDLEKQLEIAISEKEHISEQYELAKSFDYSSEWYSQQNIKLDKIETGISECNNHISDYQTQKEQLNSEIKNSEKGKENIINAIHECQNRINVLKEVTENIQKEQNLANEISDLDSKLKTANLKLKDIEKELDDLNNSVSELETRLSQAKSDLEFAQKAYNETSTCSEAPIKEGRLEDLFEQYQALSKEQSSEIEMLKNNLKDKNQIIETNSSEILKRNIDKTLYENTAYNKQFYENLANELSEVKTDVAKADNDYHEANNNFIVAKHDFENISRELEKFGEPVPENQIHSDFEKRRLNIKQEISQLNQNLKDTEKNTNSVSNILEILNDIDISQRREESIAVKLMDNIKAQFGILHEEWKKCKNAFINSLNNAKENLNTVINKFDKDNYELKNSLINLRNMMNETKGENIFSLNDMANNYAESAKKMIVKIDTDLSSINRCKYDLSHQCTLYAEQVYNGLKHIKDSKVKVYEDKSPKNILKIDIPDNFDFDSAQRFIESEIDSSVEQFANREFFNDEQKKKESEKIVSSGQLLRTAIQKSSLKVQAYKIDVNPANASYRTWEESLKNNSGAEKFIVYLSIILSIMNYSKSESAGIQNNSAYSVLILDNPFGSTTSPHILNPMFNLAKHFKVQMVCLTHITQNDVIKCFDFVIKAFTKKIAMSSKELLVHEINEEKEILNHGFYGVSEQLPLL